MRTRGVAKLVVLDKDGRLYKAKLVGRNEALADAVNGMVAEDMLKKLRKLIRDAPFSKHIAIAQCVIELKKSKVRQKTKKGAAAIQSVIDTLIKEGEGLGVA